MSRHQKSRNACGRQKTHDEPLKQFASGTHRMFASARPSAGELFWKKEDGMNTLLLVDNNMEHLLQHSDILGRAGYRIVTAQDGKSAQFILDSGMPIDVIVTEYTLPDMEPGEFLAVLRKELPAVPVIVATTCDSVESYMHAINLGVYEYMNKPLLPGELRGIVKSVVDARQASSLSTGLA